MARSFGNMAHLYHREHTPKDLRQPLEDVHGWNRFAIQDDFQQGRRERVEQGRLAGLGAIVVREIEVEGAEVWGRSTRTKALISDEFSAAGGDDAGDQTFAGERGKIVELHVKAAVAGVGGVRVNVGLKVGDGSLAAVGLDDNDFDGVVGDGVSVAVGGAHDELLPTVVRQLGARLLDDLGVGDIVGVKVVEVTFAVD